MSELAKWCPQCGTLTAIADTNCRQRKCNYIFTGGELGSKIEPVIIDTESEIISDDMISSRLPALSEESSNATTSRKEDLRICLTQIGQSALVAIIGIAIMALGVFIKKESGGRGGLWSGLIGFFGAAGCLSAIVLFVSGLWRFLRPPKFTSPKQVADCFYGQLIGADRGGVSRAWACLDSKARAHFSSPAEFKNYWDRRESDMKQWALDMTKHLLRNRPKGHKGDLQCVVHVKAVSVQSRSEMVADLRCEIMASVYELVVARKDLAGNPIFVTVYYELFIWPQAKTLLLGASRWYLTSGTLEGPKA